MLIAVSEAEARARWRANRDRPRRHDVPDDNFAAALAYYEPPGDDEPAARYDGAVPVERWVGRLPAGGDAEGEG